MKTKVIIRMEYQNIHVYVDIHMAIANSFMNCSNLKMVAKLLNTLIIHVLFCSSILMCIFSRVVLSENGFKFNCGFNLCTFPSMYCDIDNGVCKYCNVDVCNLEHVPQQCYEACSEFLPDTSMKHQTSRATGSDVIAAQVDISPGNIIIITICGTILVFCVIMLISVAKPLLCKTCAKYRIWQTPQKEINIRQNVTEHCIEMNDMQTGNASKQRKSTDQELVEKVYKENKNEHFITEENASGCPLLQPPVHPKGAASLTISSDKTRRIHTSSPVTSTGYGNHERQFDYELLSPGNP